MKTKKVLFHTGRGGSFNNPGYVTCKGLIDAFDAEYYGINIFFNFENRDKVESKLGIDNLNDFLDEKIGVNIDDFACNFENYKNDFDALNLIDQTQSSDDDILYIKHLELGDPVVVGETGYVFCTLEEYNSENGSFDIDGEYNSYSWRTFDNLDEDDLKIMIRDLRPYEYEDELIESGVDANVFNLLKESNKIADYIEQIYYQMPWDEFKEKFTNEFEDVMDEDNYIEVGGKFYTIY